MTQINYDLNDKNQVSTSCIILFKIKNHIQS